MAPRNAEGQVWMAVLVPSPGNLGTFSAFLSCLHALSFLTANQHLLLFPKAALDLLEPAWLACAGSWLEVSGIYSPATLKDCRKHDSPCFTTQLSTILRGNSHSCTPSRIRPPSAGGGKVSRCAFLWLPIPFSLLPPYQFPGDHIPNKALAQNILFRLCFWRT